MKQTVNKWMPAAVLTVCGMMLLSGCKHDANDYVKKPYSMTDDERIVYAEQTLGTTIDRQHDWSLTTQYSVKITADADLENISEVAVLDDDPYAGRTYRLAVAAVTSGGSATLTFRAPKDAEVLYAACYNTSGQCIARPFVPGTDTQVSLREVLTAGSQSSASAPNNENARMVFSINALSRTPIFWAASVIHSRDLLLGLIIIDISYNLFCLFLTIAA